MERRRSCAPRGNGTLERHGAGRRSKREPGKASFAGRRTSSGATELSEETREANGCGTCEDEAEQRGSPVGRAGSNLSRRSFRRSLRRRDGRRRKPCGRTERGRIPQSALEGNLRRRSPPGADGKQALRAMVAGAAAEAEEGRSRSRLPGRKRRCARRSICPGTDAAGRLRSLRSAGRGRERTGRLIGARRESSRSGNLPREWTTEAGCVACGTPAAGGSERAGCPEAEPKRACACAGRRGGVSTKGVLPEPAEAVPRSGTEQPEAGTGAGSNR